MNSDYHNAAFVYTVAMLRFLQKMELLTPAEVEKITEISRNHYDTKIIVVPS